MRHRGKTYFGRESLQSWAEITRVQKHWVCVEARNESWTREQAEENDAVCRRMLNQKDPCDEKRKAYLQGNLKALAKHF